ncbi:M20/M25/M40 family metallo-hydrolase [Siccirubricoccus deserti]
MPWRGRRATSTAASFGTSWLGWSAFPPLPRRRKEADLHRYLAEGIQPWLEQIGFSVAIHPNPIEGFGPILTAERVENPALQSILLYGHGDTVRGLDEQWRDGLKPWALTEEGDRWYGRGTADNKGQHALNLAALEAVLAERGGRLGFNVKLVLEMAEERGSRGLREFVAANTDLLAADVLIASDGPRVDPALPTIATGTRGIFQFELELKLRAGGVHSGHWGGLTTDPAVVLTHAIGSIMDRKGRILVRDWLPRNGVPAEVRGVLDGCPVGGADGAATIDADWGEPGLTPAEKIYGWNSFIVLAMVSGRPEAPVNAVAPDARATCHIRYTVDTDPAGFEAALRRHLDEHGFPEVEIRDAGVRMAASRTPPNHPWVRWAQDSMARSLGKPVQIIPNSSGGLPGDVFVDHLGTPLVWVPHSYNGCKQHGPDEHLLIAPAREGIMAFAGLWWDLGEAGTPKR